MGKKNEESKSIEETYIKLSPIEHVLKKPGMYVGDLDFRNEKQFIYNKKTDKIEQKTILWSPGLYKIVDELVVNSYDQSIRDPTLKIISTKLDSNTFSIFNDGIGIDVILHPVHKIYIPELIFGNLLTSTNYDESTQRITGGTHGLGAKLSAIFSKKFTVEVWDAKRKLYYLQSFENNLSNISKPVIKKYTEILGLEKNIENILHKNHSNKIVGGVKISIEPDFSKFKSDCFSPDMIDLLSRRVVDLIGLARGTINVFLNGEKISRENEFDSYLNLFSSEQAWISTHCVKNPLWSFSIRFNDGKSIEPGTHISFVNGIFTNRGGKHVEYITDLLVNKFTKLIGNEFNKKLLNDWVTICLKASVVNPTFNSQTKEELNTPITKFGLFGSVAMECIIPDSFWNQVKNSPLVDQLKQVLMLSNQKILSKLDGSKKSKIKNLPKLEDANFAGTKKSIECVLILTEGDSAKATAISGISAISAGRNYYGVYPLRGKLLNVREASSGQINSNQEITDIKKILGLKSGVSYNKSNINELRYGSVMIMTDADEDGSHIKGLIINFFDYFFPTLLEIPGFMRILVTPLVKAIKGTNVINFANLRAYGVWKEKTKDIHTWKIKYYKGLGTSTAKEAGEYFVNINTNTINVIDTVKTGSNPDILLAFAKDQVGERKIWLQNYKPDNILQLEPPSTITVSQFIHQELIHFSNYDNIRSIPSIADGFKPSQRKVLYACLKRNLVSEAKVAQLAAAVAEVSAYHHGEQSLVATIINMAQNFVGSNNINLLVPQGQFGTRLMGGKDHSSARYIYTFLESVVSKIFVKSDSELLEYLNDDGYPIEPKYYLPIIPLVLINGAEGIGTGFSTGIPNYNPTDIIKWIINKLNSQHNKNKLVPWYKGFFGNIIKYDINTWISTGKYSIDYKLKEVKITELPVRLWTNDYKEWLEEWIYESKSSLFKSYMNLSSDVAINFVCKFDSDTFDQIKKLDKTVDPDGITQLAKLLRLNKTIKQSNMNLYTTDYTIKIFKSAEEILEEFYHWRLEFYTKRRDLLLVKYQDELKYIEHQIKFVDLVIQDKGKIFTLEPEQIDKYLKLNKIPYMDGSYDYLTNMTFKQLTRANLERLESKLKTIKQEFNKVNKKTGKDLWLEDLNELSLLL
jgi:DNA topoisomerase-2